ncbi:MAG TPA: hypothetical protein VE684_14100 [Crenalkalicoccus sp.]|nr:hypothetical protein [Crenalkalicoccus sp.]
MTRNRPRFPAAPVLGVALGLLVAPTLAHAEDGSSGTAAEAAAAAVQREGTGWQNGAASLSPAGDGAYTLSHDVNPRGQVGMGMPRVVDTVDGRPVIQYTPVPSPEGQVAGR